MVEWIAGRIETGIVKPGDEVEIVGLKPGTKTSVTGMNLDPFHTGAT